MSAVDVPTPTGVDRRSEVVRGLRELADFIESNEAVPPPEFVHGLVYRSITKDGPPVDAAAIAAIGGKPEVVGGKVKAKRQFAGDVEISIEARAKDICVPREVTTTEFVLPDELRESDSASELSEADTTAVTW